MGLNTLKEINLLVEDFPILKEGEEIEDGIVVFKRKLRAEAVKWVKPNDWSSFWEWCRRENGWDYLYSNEIEPISFIEAWIEYFFNLT